MVCNRPKRKLVVSVLIFECLQGEQDRREVETEIRILTTMMMGR
jgi:hypothetical protein